MSTSTHALSLVGPRPSLPPRRPTLPKPSLPRPSLPTPLYKHVLVLLWTAGCHRSYTLRTYWRRQQRSRLIHAGINYLYSLFLSIVACIVVLCLWRTARGLRLAVPRVWYSIFPTQSSLLDWSTEHSRVIENPPCNSFMDIIYNI